MSVEGGCRSEDCLDVVSSAYPLHVFTQACNVGDECCCSGLFCWFSHCVGFAGHLYKGLRTFQDSSEVVLFSLYILLLDNGSCSVEEAGDHTLFQMAWMVRGKFRYRSVWMGFLWMLISSDLHVSFFCQGTPSFWWWRNVSGNGSFPSTSCFTVKIIL